jgi:hypothetical protein
MTRATSAGDKADGRLRPSDGIVLAVIVGGVTAIAYQLLGLRGNALIVILIVTWLSGAVRRLSEFRHGRRPPLTVDLHDVRGMALIVAGMGGWFVMGWLRIAYPASELWTPLAVPAPLYALAIVLALATLAEPFIQGALDQRYRSLIPMAAICLLSGSPIIGLFSCIWLVLSFHPSLGVSGGHRRPDLLELPGHVLPSAGPEPQLSGTLAS